MNKKVVKTVLANGMYKSYFKIGWRNLVKSKGYSAINITGLAAGVAVAVLISLWIWDELTYNKYHKNYDRVAQVWQHATYNAVKTSSIYIMNNWLLQYEYRTILSWHIFAAACLGGVAITLLTVSFQAIKAAVANPVDSLRSE